MTVWHPGQIIEIPCEVAEGAFPGERLVSIDTKTGPVSGFVREEDLSTHPNGTYSLKGVIRAIDEETIVVWLRGSFFTTTGIAYLHRSAVGQ